MSEIFKDIRGYEGLYQVSNLGNIKNTNTKKILKPIYSSNGYLTVCLYDKGNRKRFLIHRLVMLNFNGESKLQVNHKDGVKTNNDLSNLEYCTQYENILHAFDTGISKGVIKKINQYDLMGIFIKKWDSLGLIYRILGISVGSVGDCCRNKRKTAGGFIWKYD